MSIQQEIELLKRRIAEMQEELRLLELCAEEEHGPGGRVTRGGTRKDGEIT